MIEIKNNDYLQILGAVFENLNYNIQFSAWSDVLGQLSFKATRLSDGAEFFESISTVDKQRMVDIFLGVYGFALDFSGGNQFLDETLIKAQALIVAGFSRLIKQNDDYSVDNVFTQNFLTQEELEYLLKEGIEEIPLSDLK